MVFLLINSNLLNLPMSLLAASNLACWLVSSATIWPLNLFPKLKTSFYNMPSFFCFLKTLLVSLMRWSSAMFHQEVQGLFWNSRTWGYVVQFTLLLSIFDDYELILLSPFVYDSDQLLSCTLWDAYCLQFLEYLNELENDGPIIVLLTNARIKEG